MSPTADPQAKVMAQAMTDSVFRKRLLADPARTAAGRWLRGVRRLSRSSSIEDDRDLEALCLCHSAGSMIVCWTDSIWTPSLVAGAVDVVLTLKVLFEHRLTRIFGRAAISRALSLGCPSIPSDGYSDQAESDVG